MKMAKTFVLEQVLFIAGLVRCSTDKIVAVETSIKIVSSYIDWFVDDHKNKGVGFTLERRESLVTIRIYLRNFQKMSLSDYLFQITWRVLKVALLKMIWWDPRNK